MNLPQSAADAPVENKQIKNEEENIFAIVKGSPMFFTRKDAFKLASMLIISLEADDA